MLNWAVALDPLGFISDLDEMDKLNGIFRYVPSQSQGRCVEETKAADQDDNDINFEDQTDYLDCKQR